MFQAIVTLSAQTWPALHVRSQHSTIEPLLFDDLRREFDTAWTKHKKTEDLLHRILNTHIWTLLRKR